MTVLVGVKCSDGVVIGADSIATSSYGQGRLMQIKTEKLAVVGDRVIIASTGSVGLGQRFVDTVGRAWTEGAFQTSCVDCARHLARAAIGDFQQTGVPYNPASGWGYGALVAAPHENRPELVEFGTQDFQPEIKSERLHFVSMGSGQMLAEPFMGFISRVIWGEQVPDVRTAMFGVYWALNHAIQMSPGGVGEPIRLATLRQEGNDWVARLLEPEELEEQAQHIAAIEERIADYPLSVFRQAAAEPVPAPPEAEA